MGRKLQVIAQKGVVAHRERAAEREFSDAGSIPACKNPVLRHNLSIESFRRADEFGLSVKAASCRNQVQILCNQVTG
jgi:hypothetical protein